MPHDDEHKAREPRECKAEVEQERRLKALRRAAVEEAVAERARRRAREDDDAGR